MTNPVKHPVLRVIFTLPPSDCDDSNAQIVTGDEALQRLQPGDATLLLLFAVYAMAGRLSALELLVPQLSMQAATAHEKLSHSFLPMRAMSPRSHSPWRWTGP
ncbi:MAG: hypothetical protein ACYCSR_13780 [Thiomonas sp.]|uniref:Uncharacterized protein n=1 Tax=mine drainage metagenome TaxID=410659 RepID=E6PSA3_9ZZZZ